VTDLFPQKRPVENYVVRNSVCDFFSVILGVNINLVGLG
jgi:hypothetical protein